MLVVRRVREGSTYFEHVDEPGEHQATNKSALRSAVRGEVNHECAKQRKTILGSGSIDEDRSDNVEPAHRG